MKIITSKTISDAYKSAVEYVLNYGNEIITENNEYTLESDALTIIVENPLSEPLVSPLNPMKEHFLEKYASDLINGTKSLFEYDYHTRLFEWGKSWFKVPQNQIEYIIHKLNESKNTRRAIAITNEPIIDNNAKDIPCLQLLQCVIRNNKLHLTVVFRSNDMLLASGANMYAFVQLQKYIAKKVNVDVGTYTHIALIPHIYYIRDANYVKQFVGEIDKTCKLYNNP